MTGRAPTEASSHRGAGGLHVAQADRAALSLIGGEELRAAPSGQYRRQFPGKIDGISHAGVHSETASGDHQVRSVTGDKNAAFAVTLRTAKVLRPFIDRQH